MEIKQSCLNCKYLQNPDSVHMQICNWLPDKLHLIPMPSCPPWGIIDISFVSPESVMEESKYILPNNPYINCPVWEKE